MPLVSVIVPVYKVEKYLSRCIDSILGQTLKDFELILKDDGSPDGCGVICDEYSIRDNRIRVFHRINEGVSAARNLGIAEAKGKYSVFVDSDDYIHQQMLELLSNVLDHTEYPFVHCAFHRIKEGEKEEVSARYEYSLRQVQEFSSEQGMLKMMDWKTYGHYIWKGMYRTSYIRDIVFPLNVRWEDVIWSGKVVGKARKYAYVSYDLYSYFMREDSLVQSSDWGLQKQYFSAFTRYLELVRNMTPIVATEVELETFQSFIERENTLHEAGIQDSNVMKEICNAVKNAM